ncbi:hypothetical protein TorRG33x02_192680 [Trema orientale]|uniref:F-box associated domain n=1 Tax=Trema orientale TaxID=63057 RepID=A0A2P5EHJ8_TREOI|nr:hypothetical protein TorRG33x02_192680 [Trema orientale]
MGRSSDLKKIIIIPFDLADEEFRDIEINIPGDDHQESGDFHRCFVFQDCLSVSFIRGFGFHDNKIEVWVMKEYGVEGSWTRQYCVSGKDYIPLVRLFEFMIDGINGQYLHFGERRELPKCNSRELSISSFDELKVHPYLASYMFNFRESLVPTDRKDKDQFRFGW